ncbi:MAG TPA: toll/interleukin-1 receptor domain-containing protein [Nitrososphaeraceae archaeon]|nr:toll/interleukin-1 receptor domain-containing protein [Nitrososphaeraceae archaeon]
MPRNQIFISHSAKDKEISTFFIRKFRNTGVKPVLMEYEKWSRNNRPNWKWIKDEIQKSSALFLVLTKNIVKNEYTQNWVAFEIGVAATSHPAIPIFVFREHNIDFPVPYLNYYFDKPMSNTNLVPQRDISSTILNAIFHGLKERILEQIIENKNPIMIDRKLLKCSNCLLEFAYFGREEKLICPCCSNIIIT